MEWQLYRAIGEFQRGVIKINGQGGKRKQGVASFWSIYTNHYFHSFYVLLCGKCYNPEPAAPMTRNVLAVLYYIKISCANIIGVTSHNDILETQYFVLMKLFFVNYRYEITVTKQGKINFFGQWRIQPDDFVPLCKFPVIENI